ncbi:SDR family oxidoreductase [Nocardioides jishulii]|uniref:SDR family oxidoreductase n=1 Tax=Nocardioides jishulii TaxID=2575440 RepID=A0A4U2YS69_9ACTN|nr:SDR family oxidoreductase [Nocardioides jishulii]QCX26226.1 SDR family oxidoreductase [Nocardioides jishulii]TKI63970.1 SDR family oxidoreductase [Nocardioides jishulii]
MTQTILITGASSGLGAEMARQFAARGHHLALCARRTERLEELRDEITAAIPGCRVAVRALDVNDHDAVFEVFRSFRDEAAADGRRIDRVVVNAGIGKGAPLGTGKFHANKETAMTNFVAGLAQTEAAMELFRAQDGGHLVMISSVSAKRGMPKAMTAYAATKAGVAHLAEGVRTELHGKPQFKVSVIYPGFILSEMSDPSRKPGLLMASTEKGVRAIVDAVEKEKKQAAVPGWPWTPLSTVLKVAPLGVVKKMV